MQSQGVGVPTKPAYWILNSWVGGWGGTPPSTTTMPVSFEVDYMRVYRVDGLIADPEIHLVDAATKYTREDVIGVAVANFDEACVHVDLFDGDTLVSTTSTAPYAFSTSILAKGTHQLLFGATDGVRRTTAEIAIEIE